MLNLQRAKVKCVTKQLTNDYVIHGGDTAIMACPSEVVQHLVYGKCLHIDDIKLLFFFNKMQVDRQQSRVNIRNVVLVLILTYQLKAEGSLVGGEDILFSF